MDRNEVEEAMHVIQSAQLKAELGKLQLEANDYRLRMQAIVLISIHGPQFIFDFLCDLEAKGEALPSEVSRLLHAIYPKPNN